LLSQPLGVNVSRTADDWDFGRMKLKLALKYERNAKLQTKIKAQLAAVRCYAIGFVHFLTEILSYSTTSSCNITILIVIIA
jgi:hypothetical protein